MTVQVLRWDLKAPGLCVLVCRDCAAGHADVGREVQRYEPFGDVMVSFLPRPVGYIDTHVDTLQVGRSFRWRCWTCREEQPPDGPTWSVVIEDQWTLPEL